MPTDSQKYLVGLVSPETLTAAESEELHPARIDYESCDILEIRYDFFDESEWTGLSARIRKLIPNAIQLGTIRLKRDGGTFPDAVHSPTHALSSAPDFSNKFSTHRTSRNGWTLNATACTTMTSSANLLPQRA